MGLRETLGEMLSPEVMAVGAPGYIVLRGTPLGCRCIWTPPLPFVPSDFCLLSLESLPCNSCCLLDCLSLLFLSRVSLSPQVPGRHPTLSLSVSLTPSTSLKLSVCPLPSWPSHLSRPLYVFLHLAELRTRIADSNNILETPFLSFKPHFSKPHRALCSCPPDSSPTPQAPLFPAFFPDLQRLGSGPRSVGPHSVFGSPARMLFSDLPLEPHPSVFSMAFPRLLRIPGDEYLCLLSAAEITGSAASKPPGCVSGVRASHRCPGARWFLFWLLPQNSSPVLTNPV